MKKIFLTLLAVSVFSLTYVHAAINEKVLKVFKETFPNTQDPKWYEYADYYEVYFDKDDIKCRIKYDFDGNVISTRRDYYPEKLSPFIKAKVQKRYADKSIYGITEVSNNEEMFYVIVLEDAKSWMKVRADAYGNTSVLEKFKKAVNN